MSSTIRSAMVVASIWPLAKAAMMIRRGSVPIASMRSVNCSGSKSFCAAVSAYSAASRRPIDNGATCGGPGEVTSPCMADQSLSDQAREAVLKAIIKSAPTVGNSPAGIRDLAEAYALLERNLIPNAGVVQPRT